MHTLTFAEVFVTLYAGHLFADHVIQTDTMAARKAGSRLGDWAHALDHAASHVLVNLGMLIVLARINGVTLDRPIVAASLVFIGGTHLIIDRRWPVQLIMRHTGSPEWAKGEGPIHGPYLVDQALHVMALWIAAFPIAYGVAALHNLLMV